MNRQSLILHVTALFFAAMLCLSGQRAWGQFAAIEEIHGSNGDAASSTSGNNNNRGAQTSPVGGAVTSGVSADSSSRVGGNNPMIEMLRRMEELQIEVQRLRADVDVLNHDMEGMKNRQRDIYLDIDRRIQAIEAGGGAPRPSSGGQTSSSVDPGQAATVISANNARNAYASAFKLLQDKRFDEAISAFEQYVKEFPDSEYSDNAQYWMGEANYVTRRFSKAEEAFKQMIARYPASAKIADAKLKLGFTYYEMARYDDARNAMKRVIQEYPGTSSARIADERLQRMSREGR